jgi:hypothetical protein
MGGGSSGGAAGGSSGGAGGGSGGGTAGGSSGGAGGGSGGGSGGGTADAGTPLSGDTCSVAGATILAPTTLSGQTLSGYTDDYRWSGSGCVTSTTLPGPDRSYSVRIPAGRRLRAVVTPSGNWDPAIQLVDSCSTSTNQACVASINRFGFSSEQLDFVNTATTDRNVFLLVDSSSSNAGTFSLAIDFLVVPPGDVCGAPTLVGTASNQDFVGFVDDYASTAGCLTGTGPDRVYSVPVGSGERLTTTVTGTLPDGGSFSPSVSIVGSQTCSANPTCVAAARGSSATTTVLYDNPSSASQVVSVIIDATSGGAAGGSFSITTSLGPPMPPAGDLCSNAAPLITTPTSLPNQPLTGYANHYSRLNQGATCAFDDGPDRVYAVSIPPGNRMRAQITANFVFSVSVVDGPASSCSAASVSCLARFTRFGGTQVILQDNSGTTPRTVFLIVDRGAITPVPDTFDLGVDFAPFPANDTCNAPGMSITANTTLTNQSLAFASDEVVTNGNRCGGGFGLADLVYPVTVAAGSRVSVTTTSMASGFEPIISLIDAASCSGAPVCLASGPVIGAGSPRTAVLDNTSMMTRAVFAVVEPFGSSTGPFDVVFSFTPAAPPPYTKTTFTAACVPLSMSAVTQPVVGDDEVTAFLALPFPFSFFGAPVAGYAVSSNGNVQLSTSVAGSGSTSFSNAAIPSPQPLNGFVAALWDDLATDAMSPAPRVRTDVLGTMGSRRFVTEWENVVFLGSSAERLTFQIHLVEATNVIEIHYCSLAANGGNAGRTSGDSATVGVESIDGLRGIEHSFNTPMSISTGLGLRFTP